MGDAAGGAAMTRPMRLEKNHRHPNSEKTVSLREKLLLTLSLCVATGVASALLTTDAAAQSPCGLCDTKTATLDGMGRLLNIKHPSVFGREIEVDGSYDPFGRLFGQSNPYFPRGFGGPTPPPDRPIISMMGLIARSRRRFPDGSVTSVSLSRQLHGYHGCRRYLPQKLFRPAGPADRGGRTRPFNAGTAADPTGL